MENQLPQTATEYLTLAPNTQTSIDLFSDSVIEAVKAGEVNPITVLIQLRAMEKASGRILKEIHENIMREADKYPTNEFEFAGNKLTKAEHGTKYDYSTCNDPVFERLCMVSAQATAQVEERRNFLKAIKTPISLVDEATGEVATISPPTKKSTSGLNVTIK